MKTNNGLRIDQSGNTINTGFGTPQSFLTHRTCRQPTTRPESQTLASGPRAQRERPSRPRVRTGTIHPSRRPTNKDLRSKTCTKLHIHQNTATYRTITLYDKLPRLSLRFATRRLRVRSPSAPLGNAMRNKELRIAPERCNSRFSALSPFLSPNDSPVLPR